MMPISTIYKVIGQFSITRQPALSQSAIAALLPARLALPPGRRTPARWLPQAPPPPAQRPWLLLLLVVAVLVNLALAFVRNYHLRLDGDIAAIVWPRADYAQVLHDPFGWSVLAHGSYYAGPNRFFAHLAMVLYWRHVPLLLQYFVSPIASLYAAQAIFATGVQALLLYVMGWYAAGTRHLGSGRLWLAMALMGPFFQTTGYNRQMAIMDNASTYNFFYPLPLLVLLVLLWPLYRAARQGQALRVAAPQLVAMLLLGVVLAFNGPIITGVVLVLLLGAGLHLVRGRWPRPASQWLQQLPWQALVVWGWLGALCLYSLFIGRHNTENITTTTMPLAQRYQLVPYGVFITLTDRLGMPVLVLGCLANVQLIRRLLPPSAEGQWIVRVLPWIGLFALVYALLLPLGGYRIYRPYILHHDCIVPITVALVAFYGLSATYLLTRLPGRALRWYAVGVGLVAAIYINADRRMYASAEGPLERRALEIIAHAGPGPVVRLPVRCTVLSWDPLTEPLSSLTIAEMLHYWHVTQVPKMYYCPTLQEQPRPPLN